MDTLQATIGFVNSLVEESHKNNTSRGINPITQFSSPVSSTVHSALAPDGAVMVALMEGLYSCMVIVNVVF